MSEMTFVRAWPRDPATGAEVEVRLAGGGTSAPYVLDGAHYRAGLQSRPRLSARIDVKDLGFTGRSVPNATALVFAPSSAALRDELLALAWKNARVEIDGGPEDGAMARILTGNISDVSLSEGLFTFTAADISNRFDKAVLAPPFAGTGGLEGFAGAAGRMKRRSWGKVRNVEGRLLDAANNIYEFGDPAHALQAFTALRDKGRDAISVAVITWAGTAAATLAALIASTPVQGGGVVAPSIACAKWWTQPAGPLTADIEGEIGAGYVATVPAIASRLVELAGGSAITNLATAIGWRGSVAGLHITEAGETWAGALDQLTLGSSLIWVADAAGDVTLREAAFTAPAMALNALFLGRASSLPPTRNRTIIYRRNNRVHSDAEISAALLATDVVYDDGTPVQSLQPAEAGADVTAVLETVAPIAFTADYLGVIGGGQLPKTVALTRRRGTVDVSASTTWSIIDQAGITGATVTVSSSGVVTIPDTASVAAASSITVRSVRDTITIDMAIGVTKASAMAPVVGGAGGATTVSDATLNAMSTNSFVALSDLMTVSTGSVGTIQFAAELETHVGGGAPAGYFDVEMIWRYRTVGGSFADVGTAALSGAPALSELESGEYFTSPGSISCSPLLSGLSASTSYEIQLYGRRTESTPTRTVYASGTVSGVGA